MSQFNSIFSPLSNKLARLAGINLLAVVALFASIQQVGADVSCVPNLTIALDGGCVVIVPLSSVIVGTAPSGHYLLINDASPSDSNKITTISPVTGFTYGVFNSANQLVCQGTIVANDFSSPVMAPANRTEWEAIDTIVMWSDDINNVLNVAKTWQRDLNTNGLPTNWEVWGSSYPNTHNNQTSADYAASLWDWNRYYTGRPYFVDSCELRNGAQPATYRVLTLNKDNVGPTSRPTANATRRASLSTDSTALIQIGFRVQVKVTDDIEYNQCNPGYYAKLTRKFQFIDQRGNDTTTNQIIYFRRPEFSRGTSGSAYVRADVSITGINIDAGPSTLGQFGPFGKSIRRPRVSPTVEADYGLDQMADSDGDGLYNLGMDTIAYNLSNQVDGICKVAP